LEANQDQNRNGNLIMNSEIETSIETLVGDLSEAERNEARATLRACNFTDTNDPVFGLMRYWQLRAKSVGDRERPLAAEVRQMALEMDSRLWEARRFKLTVFIMCLVLAFFLGGLLVGGSFFHMARVNPGDTMNYLGLTDPQIKQLQDAGVRLRVEVDQSHVAVGLQGVLLHEENRPNGEHIVTFLKQP
jgi:hypothetical protein